MLHHGLREPAALLRHVGKVHQRPVGQAQSQIQVPQADVTVQAQHPLAHQGQGRAHTGGKGGLAGASLTGDDGDNLSHNITSFQNTSYFV